MNKIFAFFLCIVLMFSFAGCAGETKSEKMDTTVSVETVVVERGSLSAESTYIGTMSAEGTASVISLVSGTVEDVYVSTGDVVSAGDVLCRFDDESALLTMRNAEAGYNSARQAYNSAEKAYNSTVASYGGENLKIIEDQVRMAEENYDATLALFEAGAASRLEVDQAKQAFDSATAGLNSAKAGLEAAKSNVETARAGMQSAEVGLASAEYQLSLYRLETPISGVVESVSVIPNNFTPSGTVAFVISNAKNKTVTFYVTNEVMKNMTIGQPVTVSAQHGEYSGTVSEIGGIVDSKTGLFKIKALIDEAGDIPDGLSVSVTTVSNTTEDSIVVSSDSLYFDNGQPYVYRVEDGKAVRVDVEVSLYTKEKIAIASGLSDNDVIITSWSSNLKDGAVIRVNEENETDVASGEVTAE